MYYNNNTNNKTHRPIARVNQPRRFVRVDFSLLFSRIIVVVVVVVVHFLFKKYYYVMYKLRNTLSRERVLRVKMKIFFFWNFLFGLSFWENTRSKISRTCHCFRFLHKNMCGNISRTITDSLIVTTTSGDTVRLQTTSINGTSKLEAQRCGPEDCQVVLFFFSLSLSLY